MIKIFYTDAMVADSESFSPSARKPAEMVKFWQALGLQFDLVAPYALTIDSP